MKVIEDWCVEGPSGVHNYEVIPDRYDYRNDSEISMLSGLRAEVTLAHRISEVTGERSFVYVSMTTRTQVEAEDLPEPIPSTPADDIDPRVTGDSD